VGLARGAYAPVAVAGNVRGPGTHRPADRIRVADWVFYVVPTAVLEGRLGGQKSMGLSTLEKLTEPVGHQELKEAVGWALRPITDRAGEQERRT